MLNSSRFDGGRFAGSRFTGGRFGAGSAAPFVPSDIPGLTAWFEARDLTAQFSDPAGQYPATPGQTVGMFLGNDAGRALGPELSVTKFSSIDSVWTDNGDGTYTADGSAASGNIKWLLTGTPNAAVIRAVYTLISRSSGIIGWARQIVYPTDKISTLGQYTGHLLASQANPELWLQPILTPIMTVGGISLREVAGRHAIQGNAAARPLLQLSGGVYYLESDPLDDSLSWTAPAGTYTVLHVQSDGTVTSSVGALSGATNILLATTTAGYLAYSGTLSAGQIAQASAYLESLT